VGDDETGGTRKIVLLDSSTSFGISFSELILKVEQTALYTTERKGIVRTCCARAELIPRFFCLFARALQSAENSPSASWGERGTVEPRKEIAEGGTATWRRNKVIIHHSRVLQRNPLDSYQLPAVIAESRCSHGIAHRTVSPLGGCMYPNVASISHELQSASPAGLSRSRATSLARRILYANKFLWEFAARGWERWRETASARILYSVSRRGVNGALTPSEQRRFPARSRRARTSPDCPPGNEG